MRTIKTNPALSKYLHVINDLKPMKEDMVNDI
jgi:hypothetical protein